MSDIRIERLTKKFGDLVAVDAADLAIAAGEVVCLLGPSGCGKTTTLRMIAGLETATSGDIYLGGRLVTNVSARERNVAMSFQFYALYPSLSVRENLAFPLHAERLAEPERRRRIDDVARILQLTALLDRRPHQLAEGEKQRVAVGRSIIREPACFLFDEPLSRLDVQLREVMRGQIKEVLSGLSKATVIVTHDQLEALTMADRIAVMRDGVIEQIATPHNIFAKPANLFVAGFIGTPSMNLLPATLIGHDGDRARFRTCGQEIRIAVDPLVAALAPDSAVTLGVRPRSMAFAAAGTDDTVTGEVDLIEPMGAETLAHLVSGGHDIRVVYDRRRALSVGTTGALRFREGQVHVFDRQGRRVGN